MIITSLIKHSVKAIKEGLPYGFRMISEYKLYKGGERESKNGGKKYAYLAPNISLQLVFLYVLMQIVVSSDLGWTNCGKGDSEQGHIPHPYLSLEVYILLS